MTDDIDRANARVEELLDDEIARIRRNAGNIPAGEPGECDHCGYENIRLVNGLCSPCRDESRK